MQFSFNNIFHVGAKWNLDLEYRLKAMPQVLLCSQQIVLLEVILF